MKNIKQTKGKIYFRYTLEGLETTKYEVDDMIPNYIKNDEGMYAYIKEIKEKELEINVYDLFDGKDFLKSVLNGNIIDYDGCIAEILVDGYISNLGIATKNLTQGDFLVDEKAWLDICENYKVEVNWANK